MRNFLNLCAAFAIAIGLTTPALATGTASGPDMSALTGAIDFSTIIAAILSVGALAIAVTLAVLGVRKVMRMIKAA